MLDAFPITGVDQVGEAPRDVRRVAGVDRRDKSAPTRFEIAIGHPTRGRLEMVRALLADDCCRRIRAGSVIETEPRDPVVDIAARGQEWHPRSGPPDPMEWVD